MNQGKGGAVKKIYQLLFVRLFYFAEIESIELWFGFRSFLNSLLQQVTEGCSFHYRLPGVGP